MRRGVTYGASRVTIRSVMDRPTFVLAAMAAAGADARFDPVRLQKYFFLLDRELEGECGCPHFDFRPYHYGPFDRAVYVQLDQLVGEGLAVVDESRRYRLYGLTEEGLERGKRAAASLPEHASRYMAEASDWLFSLDFRELIASIYEYAPDMAVRSVLPQAVASPRPHYSMHPFLRGMARSLDWSGAFSRRGRDRQAGAAALEGHWAAVGGYLRDAMARADRGDGAS